MPDTPKVLDAEGQELVVGAPVKRRTVSGHQNNDEVRAVHWRPEIGWVVMTRAMPYLQTTPSIDRNTFRCPDLTLINQGGDE